jgi:hypothetical protein
VRKGDISKATVALATVRNQLRDSVFVQDELAEIIANLEFEKAHSPHTGYIGGWLACFKGSLTDGASNIRRTIVGTGVFRFTFHLVSLLSGPQVCSAHNNSLASTSSFISAPRSSKRSGQSATLSSSR